MKQTSFVILAFAILFTSCQTSFQTQAQQQVTPQDQNAAPVQSQQTENLSPKVKLMLENAVEQTKITKSYDPNYTVLAYPNGDVPMEKGVCTDVIIRAMRAAKLDLQREVHEDMKSNFAVYPKKWGLKSADSNIDHRRVPNLQTYFKRKGKSLQVTNDAKNYKAGDIVTYDLNGKGLTHIGIVSNVWNETTKRFSIIHNIGRGAETEDVLFDWKITGHYRYF
ncbi:MAG: DUF1287 domain-containing protein [Pyrinomonadaceae bacterium]|nr:DUF1287 domain-containing protein [Pyrinomonadaceae bacterium]